MKELSVCLRIDEKSSLLDEATWTVLNDCTTVCNFKASPDVCVYIRSTYFPLMSAMEFKRKFLFVLSASE